MNPVDSLNDDATHNAHNDTATPAPVPVAAPEKGRTLRDMALEVVPKEYHGTLLTGAADAGIQHVNDPAWLIVAAEVVSLASAAACGAAASAVQSGVDGITDRIFQGAARAGDEIKSNLIHGIRNQGVEVGQALKMLIDSAASAGATSLKTAASELDVKLGKIPADVQKSLDAYKEKGVQEFAVAAKEAGKAAASHALYAQMSRSIIAFSAVILLACGIGAGGFWGYLKIEHRMMPRGVTAQSDPLMGGTLVTIPGGGKTVKCAAALCVLYPH